MKFVLVETLQQFLTSKIQATDLVEMITCADPRLLTVAEAEEIARMLKESNGQAVIIVAHLLALFIEKLSYLDGSYASEEAAILNAAIEEIFVAGDFQLQVAHCGLFKAQFQASRGDLDTSLDILSQVPEMFRAAREQYPLACSLLLRARCRLRKGIDRTIALNEVSEAENLFRGTGDEIQLQACQVLREQYQL